MGEDGHLKLTDFGESNYLNENRQRFTTSGTPIYYSPEMLTKTKEKGYDTSVDIWSCGVILFEMTCGYPPFKKDKTHTMEYNICHLNISWPQSGLNPAAKSLITNILKFNILL